jgi:hypothetical protein
MAQPCQFQHALLWGSIGWGTAATLGFALAAPSSRVVLVQGDGGHQCTVNQLGTMAKYGANPIIVLLNNDIYGVEEVVMGNDKPSRIQEFDKIALWNYSMIPSAMGCNNWKTYAVDLTSLFHLEKGLGQLKDAIEDARRHPESGAYIVVRLDKKILFPALPKRIQDRLYQAGPVIAATSLPNIHDSTEKRNPMPYTVAELEKMTMDQLDNIFKNAPPGEIPNGPAKGTALIDTGSGEAPAIAEIIRIFAWQGKTFDAKSDTLVNRISIFGIIAIDAKVYFADSLFDGAKCIVLDYSENLDLSRFVRDEIRLISPNLYLGLVYWKEARTIYFTLEFGK